MALEVAIKKKFPGFDLDVEFSCHHSCMGILGASGCGKSMTLKCIAGIVEPDEGRIALDGEVFYDSEKKINLTPQERKIGYLFQNYALFPTMNVRQNLACVLKGKKEEKEKRVREQIQMFHLQGLEEQLPAQLSGGQQQRVALARMLITNPRMIMLDEPFSALDGFLKDVLQHEVQEMLKKFPGEVLVVSHSRDELYKFSREMTIIDGGKSILTGDTKEIFLHPGCMQAARLTGCKNISPAVKTGEYEVYAEDWKIHLKTGEQVSDDIKYIGIRGHYIERAEAKEGGNCMEVEVCDYVDAPFEYHYIMKNIDGGEPVWWLVSKKSGIKPSPYIYLPKDELMLLK
jgi:molybdate transport system ATP-binding protein